MNANKILSLNKEKLPLLVKVVKISLLLGVLFVMSSVSKVSHAVLSFPTAQNSKEILNYLNEVSDNSVIFVDIDDTIITPVSKTFRKPPYNKLIDDIKQNKDQYKNYEEIVSNWRLQRKVMLIDSNWPDTLLALKQKYSVYGLTKMDTGRFGNIDSVEHWRYSELKSLGIEFSVDNFVPQESVNDASFYKGVFITGANSKSQTISYYIQHLKASTVVLIDDREEHLNDLEKFCKKNNLKFVGILFSGLDNFKDVPDANVAYLQKKHLIEHAKWIEDDEAEKLLYP